jgi:hypothetical protein
MVFQKTLQVLTFLDVSIPKVVGSILRNSLSVISKSGMPHPVFRRFWEVAEIIPLWNELVAEQHVDAPSCA